MDKRSPNFTSTEIDYLLDAVKKYSSIIENKKTDSVGAEEKLNAWKCVERDFNSKFIHTFRPHKVLKTKYMNIKATAKQNYAYDKRQTYATGGGPLQPSTTTKTDQAILEICQEVQILGKSSTYDCDAHEKEFTDIEFIDDFIDEKDGAVGGEENYKEVSIKEEDKIDTSWGKYTPKTLKRPISKVLKPSKAQDSWAKVADIKLERQKVELEFVKQKHSLEMEKLRLEIDYIKLKTNKLNLAD